MSSMAHRVGHRGHALRQLGVLRATPGDGSDRAQKLLESLWRDLFGRLVEHGCQQDQIEIEALLTMDLKLNVQGLESWLNRLAKAG